MSNLDLSAWSLNSLLEYINHLNDQNHPNLSHEIHVVTAKRISSGRSKREQGDKWESIWSLLAPVMRI
jgi:hypothetical protein